MTDTASPPGTQPAEPKMPGHQPTARPPAETPAQPLRPFKPRRLAFWLGLALFLLWLGALAVMWLSQ